jgi:secondary thiamine-phosphate synthase enzyme|tara:strand:+ start:190 stop:621 length:432 start_codon:yes stop_codon:yes gene_type:complete
MGDHIKYKQGEIIIKTSGQGMYEITKNINSWLIKEQINSGQLNIFIKHTSASLCIQENASEDVLEDILDYFTKLVPENPSLYKHNIEGRDDMPAHIKSALTQTSLIIPVKDSQMDLGTWQGVFLFEHRIASMQRMLKLTLFGN